MPGVSKIYHLPMQFSTSTPAYRPYHALFMLALSSTLQQADSIPLPNVSQFNGSSSIQLYSSRKTRAVQVAAAACAAVSMASSFVAFYWFYRMEKRFRHRLIMLLIFGDLMKAMWLFLLAVVSIARGTVATESAFCQSSGFFIQFGSEAADYAVLVIAVHNALQVFRPSNTIRSDGLYPYRHQVYIGALVIPAAMSGLAFVNPRWGYMSQGPFCSLPFRPFWYRLALAWIPRYLVTIIIIVLAIAIYAHVGIKFRAFSDDMQKNQASLSTATPVLSAISSVSIPEMAVFQATSPRRGSSIVSMFATSRRASVGALVGSQTDCADNPTRSHPTPEPSLTVDRCYAVPPLQTYDTVNDPDHDKDSKATHPSTPVNSDGNASQLSKLPSPHMHTHIDKRRIRIHRQLRLMFIYPLTYVLVWLFPFINHCFTYKDEYAKHPIFWLNLMATICLTLMGAIDCLIFSLRERPWRHIPSSDGTFLGSFAFWRNSTTSLSKGTLTGETSRPEGPRRWNTEANPETPVASQAGWKDSAMRKGKNVARLSGSSDHAKNEAGMARLRLEMEKEERRANMMVERRRRSTLLTGLDTIESPGEEKGEWGAGEGAGKESAGEKPDADKKKANEEAGKKPE